MFQVDRFQNRLRKLECVSFSELGYREREHLQEWLAAMPEALCGSMSEGEDGLLIIQKEFDGFDGTRERLDLLALDKQGQLVVIENKLDDSGRDVVWQALKYAAYCSSLKKVEIVGIFQQYLDRNGGGDAARTICEFLGEDTLDEVVLNDGISQRVVFIAANFRREVTATVLWLREHQIDARCIKVLPYRFGDEIFIDLQQVIPTPEAADYMVRMAQKESEEKSASSAQSLRHTIRMDFWQRALDRLRADGSSRHHNVGPTKETWLGVGTGVSGCSYTLVLLKTLVRVELTIQRGSTQENKWLFDQLHAQREELEQAFGATLEWHRNDDQKRCLINISEPCDGFDKGQWPDMIAWMSSHMRRLEAAFSAPLAKLNQRLKAGEATGSGR
ncbi:DUF4268 domain-containing protein (plasmid) [Cereibacter azotoformans]|uniref:Uncharacterized protein DUF4268 n=1 Tax=Cereibacter azotoformans TaxID=43057 RepID=A0A2T5JPY5_9RHOB|nr:DUF4268 domain-containing protein [Cereibacter azotoformans]AXQ96295.1 DUF4268 domain-containing protein [Cereibacter sphaeroides]MBO4170787.1 DUF4268 domain-containing protein [Cereibacter azotoformans]PTR09895.1 uncharacterized protein DUF4268 [Cereibacter azotoformans]UIJ33293.1 DUF4268 domain-containing protein [Cereibacter azotoformans]